MRRLLHKPTPGEPLVEINPNLLDAALDREGFVWLDLAGESPDEIRRIGARFGFNARDIEEAIDAGTMPRLEEHPSNLSVVLAGASTGRGTRLAIIELDLFITDSVLLTVHAETSAPSIEYLVENLQLTERTEKPLLLAGLIAQLGTRRFGPLVEELERRIDDLEEAALRASPHTLPEVHALRRDVVLLQRYVGRQREVFGELATSRHSLVSDESRRLFDGHYDHHIRLGDSLDGARTLLNSVVETYRGAVADQTNEIVRVLTVFSAIVLPLSVIAGAWGMNFVDIPGADSRWGFLILVGVMLIVGLTFWIYFVRRGFVGAPRLRELPKSVGLGLVQVGVAPIKLVSTGIGTTVREIGKLVGGTESESQEPPDLPN